MADYHEVTCKLCGVRVRAEHIRSDFWKRYYKCPNTDADGVPHVFGVTKTRWQAAKGLGLVVGAIVTGGRLLDGGNGDKKS